jgi:hypothetical protein
MAARAPPMKTPPPTAFELAHDGSAERAAANPANPAPGGHGPCSDIVRLVCTRYDPTVGMYSVRAIRRTAPAEAVSAPYANGTDGSNGSVAAASSAKFFFWMHFKRHFDGALLRARRALQSPREWRDMLFLWDAVVEFKPHYRDARHWLNGHFGRRSDLRPVRQLQAVLDAVAWTACDSSAPAHRACRVFWAQLLQLPT